MLAAAAGPDCYERQKKSCQLGVPIRLGSPCAPRPAVRKGPGAVPRAGPHRGTPAALGDRPRRPGSALLSRHDRPGGVRRQDPAQPWPPLPLEPRPPAQPPAAPPLPGAGPSNTAAASARSRSRIFPPPPGAVTRENASARRAWPAPRPPATAQASSAGSLGPRQGWGSGFSINWLSQPHGVPFHHAHVSDEKTEVTWEIQGIQS